MESFLSAVALAFVTLFPIIDPPGAVPVFCTLTADSTAAVRRKTAFKTALNVFIILLVFYFVGEFILEFFGISLGVMKIAGGVVVAHTAWDMLTSKDKIPSADEKEMQTKEDISFTPMALPLLSGPGAIGAAIGLSIPGTQILYTLGISTGIFLASVTVYIALMLSIPILRILGKAGIDILKRIMGFFILAIAVQLMVSGIIMAFKLQL
jgi:multiple antibiotic resistance protein